MRVILQIFFISISSLLYSQNNKLHSVILDVCSIKLNDSTNAYISKEKFFKNNLRFFVKTQNTIIDKECSEKNELKGKIDSSLNNPIIYLNEKKIRFSAKINDIETSIPEKLWYQKNNKILFLCIELSNYTTSTVGNGYNYLILSFYKNKLKKSKSFSTKKPLTNNEIKLLLKNNIKSKTFPISGFVPLRTANAILP